MTKRSFLRALGAAALVPALHACATYHSLFPSRDQVVKRVETNLGERRVLGSDTLYTLSGPGYALVTRRRDALPDAQDALRRAATEYRRYFLAAPPTVPVALLTPGRGGRGGGRNRQAADSAVLRVAGPRAVVVTARVHDERRDDNSWAMDAVTTVGTNGLVHAWLETRFGDSLVARGDSAGPRRLQTRLPDWLDTALPELIGGSPRADMLVGRLAQRPDSLLPLAELFVVRRPRDAAADSARDREDERMEGMRASRGAGRRDGRMGGPPPDGGERRGAGLTRSATMRFDAQAIGFARFLLQREGAAFVGAMADAVASGVRSEDVLAHAHDPVPLGTLETEWRAWLARQADGMGPMRRGR